MAEFTSKRRLLAAIRGQEVDHVPFSPSDSCPPGVAYEKFVRLAQLVREIRL